MDFFSRRDTPMMVMSGAPRGPVVLTFFKPATGTVLQENEADRAYPAFRIDALAYCGLGEHFEA